MSNPKSSHRPPGTPDGGQFSKTAQSEAAGVELGSPDFGFEGAAPTDPVQLIKYHGHERDAARQKLDDLANSTRGAAAISHYDEQWSDHAEKEFDRYSELAAAVTQAAQPATQASADLQSDAWDQPADRPAGPPREPAHDLGQDQRDQLSFRMTDLHNARRDAQDEVDYLYKADKDIDAWVVGQDRAAREEFERMCAVVDAVRAGVPTPHARSNSHYPDHLGYRPLNDFEREQISSSMGSWDRASDTGGSYNCAAGC